MPQGLDFHFVQAFKEKENLSTPKYPQFKRKYQFFFNFVIE